MLLISSKTRLLKNLLLLINVTNNDKVGVNSGGNTKNKTVKRLHFKNSNRIVDYLTFNATKILTQLS